MGASATAIPVIQLEDYRLPRTARDRLELAARLLPESGLKAAILATLADREPTAREALAWAAALQARRRTKD